MTLGIPASVWRPSRGSRPAKYKCGEEWLTVGQIAARAGLTKQGAYQRLRRMLGKGTFDPAKLLERRAKQTPKKPPPDKESLRRKVPDESDSPLQDTYLEGVAAHPDTNCPYEPISLPQSHSDRSQSPMVRYSTWWAGWNDADRGMVD